MYVKLLFDFWNEHRELCFGKCSDLRDSILDAHGDRSVQGTAALGGRLTCRSPRFAKSSSCTVDPNAFGFCSVTNTGTLNSFSEPSIVIRATGSESELWRILACVGWWLPHSRRSRLLDESALVYRRQRMQASQLVASL